MAAKGEEKTCAFCQCQLVQRRRCFITGSTDFRPYIEDLPFDVVLPPNAEYLCHICARLMQQRKLRKEKLEEVEEILIKRHNGDLTVHRLHKERKPKRQNEQPSLGDEPPNKVVVVSAGSTRRVYDIIQHQHPILPNLKYQIPKFELQFEGTSVRNFLYPTTPVFVPGIGNIVNYANVNNGVQKNLVASKNQYIGRLKVPTTNSPRLPNGNLVYTTDGDKKQTASSTISKQQSLIIQKHHNIERVNVAPACAPKLLFDKSVPISPEKEKTNSINKAVQQSSELRNKQTIKVGPSMTTGITLSKQVLVDDEKRKKKSKDIAVRSPVVPNNQQTQVVPTRTAGKSPNKQVLNGKEKTSSNVAAQQIPVVPKIQLVPTSSTEATTNKPLSSRGNTTYTFNLEALNRYLRLSAQNSNKIVANGLKNPANFELIKTLNIQSTSTNVATPQGQNMLPNSQCFQRQNVPLSVSPTTGQRKVVMVHDDDGNVSSANGIRSPIAGDQGTVNGNPTSIRLTICWAGNTKTKDVAPDLFTIAVMLTNGTHKQIALSVWRHDEIRNSLIKILSSKIQREGCGVCGLGKKEKIKVPIKCDYCDVTFKSISKMKRHVLKHTGEKPFKCDQCSKCFARKDYVRSHVQNCHKKKTDVNESLVKSSIAEIYSGMQKGSEESKSATVQNCHKKKTDVNESLVKSSMAEIYSGMQKGPEESKSASGSLDDYVAPIDQDSPTDACSPVKENSKESESASVSEQLSLLNRRMEILEGQRQAVRKLPELKDARQNNDEKNLSNS